LLAAADPPAHAVVAERRGEPRGDIGVDELVALLADALGAPEPELPHRLQAELVEGAVAGLDAEAIGRRDLAAPHGEGGRLAGRPVYVRSAATGGVGPLPPLAGSERCGGRAGSSPLGGRGAASEDIAAASSPTSEGAETRARSMSGMASTSAARNSSADWKRR